MGWIKDYVTKDFGVMVDGIGCNFIESMFYLTKNLYKLLPIRHTSIVTLPQYIPQPHRTKKLLKSSAQEFEN